MPRVQGPRGHRRAPSQRRVLQGALRPPLRRAGAPRRSTRTACSSRASGCWSRCRAARTRSRCGTSCVRLGYEADGLYLGLGIGDYSDESGEHARAFAAKLGRPLREVDLARRRTATASRRRRRRPAARRVGRAGSPSGTSSTRPRSSTATTSSRPGTTSTTKPPSSSATCCAGRPATWAVSTRCCPRRPGSCAR